MPLRFRLPIISVRWRQSVGRITDGLFDRINGSRDKQSAQEHMKGRSSLTAEEYAIQHFPFEKCEIAAQVRTIFSKHISLDISQVHPDDKLVEDLRIDALDSMSTIEFVINLEQHFAIEIPNEVAVEMRTLGDLTELIFQKVHQW